MKLLSALDLTADDGCFLVREKTRLSASFYSVGEAIVGAVTGLGIVRTGARCLAAFDEARGDGTSPRGEGSVQRVGDGRVGVSHESILRHILP